MKLFLILLFGSTVLFSQTELSDHQQIPEILTDRPDITESAIVVTPGYFQFEDGFLLENQTTTRNYTYSSLLTRIGLINNLELRLGGDYLYQVVKINDIRTNNSGFNNILIGAKYQFMNEDYNGVDLGLILQFYLPVGNQLLRPKNVEPEILLASGKSFTDVLSLSANIGSHWDSIDNIPVFLYSESFGINISHNLDSFVEIYGDASSKEPANISFDFGLAYRPVNNFQIDVSAGNESFSNFNSWFVGLGISVRIHN